MVIIWSKLFNLVKIVNWLKLVEIVIFFFKILNFDQNSDDCERLSLGSGRLSVGSGRLSVGSGRLSVGSGRLSVSPGRLSGWVSKSGSLVGQMDG